MDLEKEPTWNKRNVHGESPFKWENLEHTGYTESENQPAFHFSGETLCLHLETSM